MSNRVTGLGLHTNPPAGSSLYFSRLMYQTPAFRVRFVSGIAITAIPLPMGRMLWLVIFVKSEKMPMLASNSALNKLGTKTGFQAASR